MHTSDCPIKGVILFYEYDSYDEEKPIRGGCLETRVPQDMQRL